MPRRAVLVGASIIALLIVAVALLGPTGFRHYRRLAAEAGALETQNNALTRENEQLRQEVMQLKESPAAQEKAARDQLGYVRPGDTVYLVPTQATP